MSDILKLLADGTLPLGIGMTMLLVLLAMQAPKLLNGVKGDKIDGNLLDRLNDMDKKIHSTSIKVTRLVVLLIRLEALLIVSGGAIPKDLQDEIAELTREDE